MMNLVMCSKIFSIAQIVQSARNFMQQTVARSINTCSVRVALAIYYSLLFRLPHLWGVFFCVIATLSLKIFTKAGWSRSFLKLF